jgi:hypothetical protein
MSINALVEKIITRHLPIIMGLTAITQITQMEKAQVVISAQVAMAQVAILAQVAMAQMGGLTNQAQTEAAQAQRLVFLLLVAIQTKLTHYSIKRRMVPKNVVFSDTTFMGLTSGCFAQTLSIA